MKPSWDEVFLPHRGLGCGLLNKGSDPEPCARRFRGLQPNRRGERRVLELSAESASASCLLQPRVEVRMPTSPVPVIGVQIQHNKLGKAQIPIPSLRPETPRPQGWLPGQPWHHQCGPPLPLQRELRFGSLSSGFLGAASQSQERAQGLFGFGTGPPWGGRHRFEGPVEIRRQPGEDFFKPGLWVPEPPGGN